MNESSTTKQLEAWRLAESRKRALAEYFYAMMRNDSAEQIVEDGLEAWLDEWEGNEVGFSREELAGEAYLMVAEYVAYISGLVEDGDADWADQLELAKTALAR